MHPARLCGGFWTIFFLLSVLVALKKKKNVTKRHGFYFYPLYADTVPLNAKTQQMQYGYKSQENVIVRRSVRRY